MREATQNEVANPGVDTARGVHAGDSIPAVFGNRNTSSDVAGISRIHGKYFAVTTLCTNDNAHSIVVLMQERCGLHDATRE